ncbi:uncharacterized protein ARMOST_22386 [Armillaria ostoyae]|uniref:G-protein coupled receptors family 1 profile domain-containing protein n=1 Tax=Armillaria ostoyae TaxID=47428 RepID=A0A284SCR2_ARMOS|nr:uncharacterized protein ARMOST_22386 [Armillaria ostoyae]
MDAQPSDVSQDEKNIFFSVLDLNLNTMILQALLHGLYTGIAVVTLWTIFSSPRRLHRTFLCIIIITLYILSTIPFGINLAFVRRAFIEHGDNYYSVFSAFVDFCPSQRAYLLANGITGGISVLLVDITIIWRCWVLWDRQWRVIFVPMVCVAVGTVMKILQTLSNIHKFTEDNSKTGHFAAETDWTLIYVFMTLATTLLCTLLIIYRIVCHAPRMSASRKIIEMLIESCAMYSISLIIYLALVSRNLESSYYADIIAAYVRPIAPTLLVARVSAHANTSLRREQVVAQWENHPPLVGCFREEDTNNSHRTDDGHQTVSGLSGKETV